MKLEIDIQNPEDQATIAALAQTNGASVEDVSAHLLHNALQERQAKIADLKAHIDKSIEQGGFNTDEEVEASLNAALDRM